MPGKQQAFSKCLLNKSVSFSYIPLRVQIHRNSRKSSVCIGIYIIQTFSHVKNVLDTQTMLCKRKMGYYYLSPSPRWGTWDAEASVQGYKTKKWWNGVKAASQIQVESTFRQPHPISAPGRTD